MPNFWLVPSPDTSEEPSSFFPLFFNHHSFILVPPRLSRSACHCEVCVGSIVIGIDVPLSETCKSHLKKSA